MSDKILWSSLNHDEQSKVIDEFFDGEDADDLRQDIVDSIKEKGEWSISSVGVGTWFDAQDREFQLEILNG